MSTPAQQASQKLLRAKALRNSPSGIWFDTPDDKAAELAVEMARTLERADALEAMGVAELHAVWLELTWPERALICYGGRHGGMVYDGGEYGPECGTLVERGLVGKFEVALTDAGSEMAKLAGTDGAAW